MGTKIHWADETINPIVGCSKISAGCANCFAEPMARRLAAMDKQGYDNVISNGKWNGGVSFVASALDKPYNWRQPRSIFVGSMGDIFHEAVPFEWVDQIVKIVHHCPQHTFIFLTKRASRMKEWADGYVRLYGVMPDNLALGVTAEHQQEVNSRLVILAQTPAAIRFASIEPMLGEIDLYRGGFSFLHDLKSPTGKKYAKLDGVILGGESGSKARIIHPNWVRKVRNQCHEAGTKFMFKQWGDKVLQEDGKPNEWINAANRLPELDGRTHSELAWNVR